MSRCSTRFVLRDPDERLSCIHEGEHGICESPPFDYDEERWIDRLVRIELRPMVTTVVSFGIGRGEALGPAEAGCQLRFTRN